MFISSGGGGCTVYDVAVHPSVLTKASASDVFNGFLLTVILGSVEYKYSMELDRSEWDGCFPFRSFH